jgi:hypothetical protein
MSTEPGFRTLEREWIIGLWVVIGGFAAAIAVAALLTFGQRGHAVVPDETQATEYVPPADMDGALANPSQLCTTALANAKAFGVVPGDGRLSDPDPRQTDQDARYICDAATAKARYSIAVDIVCDQVAKASCVSIYNVAQDDGAVLYQRQN